MIRNFSTNNDLYGRFLDLHPNLGNDLILHDLDGLIIPIGKHWKNIAVSLSGGADSALLMYVLCKMVSDYGLPIKLHAITEIRNWDIRPWQQHISLDVFNRIKSLFPNLIDQRYTCYVPPELEHSVSGDIINGNSGDQIINGSFDRYATFEYGLDATYSGVTMNPSVTDLGEDLETRVRKRDSDASEGLIEQVIRFRDDTHSYHLRPFRYVKKDFVLAEYKILGMWDLFEHTRSCEGDRNMDRPMYRQFDLSNGWRWSKDEHIPECGRCFWCKERNWALARCDDLTKQIRGED